MMKMTEQEALYVVPNCSFLKLQTKKSETEKQTKALKQLLYYFILPEKFGAEKTGSELFHDF